MSAPDGRKLGDILAPPPFSRPRNRSMWYSPLFRRRSSSDPPSSVQEKPMETANSSSDPPSSAQEKPRETADSAVTYKYNHGHKPVVQRSCVTRDSHSHPPRLMEEDEDEELTEPISNNSEEEDDEDEELTEPISNNSEEEDDEDEELTEPISKHSEEEDDERMKS
ncbi:hypothetical protein SLEP1_g43443 [Rubroshorea leprosula]|uniref:Uncharacterized protein n=1 Tax=Rubroshorea leprosula TaxID=152421 RepID=A0AAV5LCZ9_9ROSI|nr:hypothetical protein SLEP1_g43443 [Rubroshorea leprosula]